MVSPCWTAVPGNRAPAVEFQLARRVREIEDYAVDLFDVGVLELIIVPDKGDGEALASLVKMRLA
jgi:hypothetical protein